MRRGYVQVYTGNGKGKTTAALGLCMRAAGSGLRIFFCQFLKKSNTSELKTMQERIPEIEIHQFGTGRFVRGKPSSTDARKAANGLLKLTDAVMSGDYDLVVADELNVAVSLSLITVENVMDLMRARPASVELVITGRNAHPRIIRAADLVTEMREKKHYWTSGVSARRGIEL